LGRRADPSFYFYLFSLTARAREGKKRGVREKRRKREKKTETKTPLFSSPREKGKRRKVGRHAALPEDDSPFSGVYQGKNGERGGSGEGRKGKSATGRPFHLS